ncbi:competence protein CoiA [Lentilactobacillus sp. SPB1-3]|uniref:Competence protein CoiA n=1 Tax=Lentilactobacillus terminaliae TaxID=3003483 RepID=A0ACD5DE03_9LACO|nr:competence protein CoiA family protein [Lentilactobacillus sp. SPB1-3]MCZ0977811.1 competence protein CoiA family protein [Lentilactobacillus sp. SPB1-3]
MLMALRNEQLVLARDANKKHHYFCPKCGSSVKLKIGMNRQPYFAHLQKLGSIEAESAQHKDGKQQLLEDMLKQRLNAQTEVVMSNHEQRADVYVPDAKIVLEYQCSSISVSNVAKRTSEYKDSEIDVWWILGDNYLKRRLTIATIQKFARFKVECGFYLIFYSVIQRKYVIWSHIQEANGQYTYQSIGFYSLHECWLSRNQITYKVPTRHQRKLEILKESKRIQIGILKKNSSCAELAELCYQRGKLLAGAPNVCHSLNGRFYPLFLKGGFDFRLRMLFTITDYRGEFLNNEELWQLYQEILRQYQINFVQVRGVSQFYLIEFRRFIRDLREASVIKYSNNGIKLIASPDWYSDYEHKRLAIEQIE